MIRECAGHMAMRKASQDVLTLSKLCFHNIPRDAKNKNKQTKDPPTVGIQYSSVLVHSLTCKGTIWISLQK